MLFNFFHGAVAVGLRGYLLNAIFAMAVSIAFLLYSAPSMVAYFLAAYTNHKLPLREYRQLVSACSRAVASVNWIPFKTGKTQLYMNLSLAQRTLGDYSAAETSARLAIANSASGLSSYSRLVRFVATMYLGAVLRAQGKFDAASAEFAKAMLEIEAPSNLSPLWTAWMHMAFGGLALDTNRLSEAVTELKTALQDLELARSPWGYPHVRREYRAWCLLPLALAHAERGDISSSKEAWQTAVCAIRDDPTVTDPDWISWLIRLAACYIDYGDYFLAEQPLQLAYSLVRDVPTHPSCNQVLDSFEKLLLITDRASDISDMRSWLLPEPDSFDLVQIMK